MIEIDKKHQISINNPFDQNRRGFSKIIQNHEFYKKILLDRLKVSINLSLSGGRMPPE